MRSAPWHHGRLGALALLGTVAAIVAVFSATSSPVVQCVRVVDLHAIVCAAP